MALGGRSGARRLLAVTIAALAVLAFAANARAGVLLQEQQQWLRYSSAWSGRIQVYALDPSDGRIAQLTFGSYPECARTPWLCGVSSLVASPDGQRLLYRVPGTLYVADVDGGNPDPLPAPPSMSPGEAAGSWSRDSESIAYTAVDGVHVVRRDGSSDVLIGPGSRPSWSPLGDTLAYLQGGNLVVRSGSSQHAVAADAVAFEWAPNGRWLAVSPAGVGLELVRADGTGARVLAAQSATRVTWAGDSSALAFADAAGTTAIVDVADRVVHSVGVTTDFEWSPNGLQLAFTTSNALWVATRAGETRQLATDSGFFPGTGVRWAPDGRSLAFYRGSGLVEIVSLGGAVQLLFRPGNAYGGIPLYFNRDITADGGLVVDGWMRLPEGMTFRPPASQPAIVRPASLTALWPVQRLAADGPRVAFAACGHVFVWTPSAQTVVQADADPSLAPGCSNPYYRMFDLALAGERVAYGEVEGGNGKSFGLSLRDFAGGSFRADGGSFIVVDAGRGTCCTFYSDMGDLTGGAASLLYGTWKQTLARVVTSQAVHVVGSTPCPCPVLAKRDDGPLVPLDVDGRRVVVSRGDAVDVLSLQGAILLHVPVAASDAAMAGNDLVVGVGSKLRDYDVVTGALLHSWPLPGAVSTRCRQPDDCGPPNGTVALADVARGLAAYLVGGSVHVIRLETGAEVFAAPADAAAFFDDGLVIASGTELRIVPFAQLR